jgi:hypothetical protein
MDRSASAREIPTENPSDPRFREVAEAREKKNAFMQKAAGIVKRNPLKILAAGLALGGGAALYTKWPAITTWAKTDLPKSVRGWLGLELPKPTGTVPNVKLPAAPDNGAPEVAPAPREVKKPVIKILPTRDAPK